MPVKTANFNMRIEEQKKNAVESLYQSLGLSLPQAVNVFFSQSLLVGGLPFEVKLPRYNEETEKAMQETRDIAMGKIEAKTYSNFAEFLEEINQDAGTSDNKSV